MRIKLAKYLSLLTVLMLIFSVVPVWAADQTGQPERAYQVDFKVLKDGTDQVSEADKYTQKPAKITVEDGVGYAQVTLLNSSWIVDFEVEQSGALQAATVIEEDAESDTRTIKFPLDNIREKIDAKFVVEVAAYNYKSEHLVQLLFDTTGMPGGSQPQPADEGEALEETEEAGATNDSEQAAPTDPSNEVQLAVHKDGTDEPSSLGNYMSKTGQLHERDGAYLLSFTLTSSSLVTAFQYESGESYADAIVLSEDKEADTRSLGIVVTDPSKKQNVALEVQAGPRGVMKHAAQIVIGAPGSNGTPQVSLSDIDKHWAKSSIEAAVARGIVSGYDDQTFRPDNSINRAQLAVILANALKLNKSADNSTLADEASVPAYAAASVAQVHAAGLMSGYEDGTFRPNASLNRAQLAVIIANVKGLALTEGAAPTFSDADSIPVWAQPAVAAATDAGLISGRSNGSFAPADAATRAEVVTVIMKLIAEAAAQ